MCGPVQCLPCQPDFLRRLKTDRQVQVWTLLWIPLVVLWVIYFGFQIDNLASAVEDKSFQVLAPPPKQSSQFLCINPSAFVLLI